MPGFFCHLEFRPFTYDFSGDCDGNLLRQLLLHLLQCTRELFSLGRAFGE